MFLRATIRKKDGKEHRYWSVVENRRVAGGRVVQPWSEEKTSLRGSKSVTPWPARPVSFSKLSQAIDSSSS